MVEGKKECRRRNDGEQARIILNNSFFDCRGGNHKEKKIHRLAYRFSIDFKIHRLAYGFLCVNHKGLAKFYRFLVRAFFSQDFKNP